MIVEGLRPVRLDPIHDRLQSLAERDLRLVDGNQVQRDSRGDDVLERRQASLVGMNHSPGSTQN